MRTTKTHILQFFHFITLKIIVLTRSNETSNNSTELVTKDIDYSRLADEAETHKGDLLNFLNETTVWTKYRTMYDRLILKLVNNNKLDSTDQKVSWSARRIVSGSNTSIEAVPWQVSVQDKTIPICGGSVLTEVWVVTAAHCLIRSRAKDLSVRLASSWRTRGGKIHDVKDTFVHPRYVSTAKINDVGLIRLHTPVRFSTKVLPIGLIARGTKIPANQICLVSGWGKIKEGGRTASFLQSTRIELIAMKLCRLSGVNEESIDPESMFCAGSFNRNSPDACQGDSGGPIVSKGVLIGVISWGLGCARGNFPGVYSRLAHPLVWDWLHVHITSD